MDALRLDLLLHFLTSRELMLAVLSVGLAAFAVGVVILLLTRWGESHPLFKCMVLSMLAHVLLFGYMATAQIVYTVPTFAERVFQVSLDDGAPGEPTGGPAVAVAGRSADKEAPWEEFRHDAVAQPEAADAAPEDYEKPPEPTRESRAPPGALAAAPALDHVGMGDAKPGEPKPLRAESGMGGSSPGRGAEAIEAPAARRRDPPRVATDVGDSPRVRTPASEVAQALTRPSSPGVPSRLLDPEGPLPKMADIAPTPGPGEALPALADDVSLPSRPAAPDAFTVGGNRSAAGGDAAYLSGGPSERTQVARLYTPSLGAGGSQRLASGDGVGDPRGTGDGGTGAGTGPAGTGSGAAGLVGPPRLPGGRPGGTGDRPLPEIYRGRDPAKRAGVLEQHGGNASTEAAVKLALKWLTATQSDDGHWDPRQHGAGQERTVGGRNRQSAGIDADTGVTGLALLALLASGHTHQDSGVYQENVRRGLEYLLKTQGSDGNLAGPATGFARMYCHAIAAFAMSEAYGMTGDRRLEQPVRRAVAYTLAAQSPTSGGWRYAPGDTGDTSQLGWQLMVLKSAELAGIPTPESTRHGAVRYLRTVASGKHGGLASYRPNEQVTRPMTAEALVCWQFLGMPRDNPASNEAGDFILGDIPPGSGKPNLYYWYYATLGMYQLQGAYWQRWNEALQTTLVGSQRKSGPLAGSWDTDTVWGGYGGRVYTTSLATLCLEVYYRFLPLYKQAGGKEAAN